MPSLTLRGIDAWITREDEPSIEWAACADCRRIDAINRMFLCWPDVWLCHDCVKDRESANA